MADQFGPLISCRTIEQAVITLLQDAPAGGSAPLIVYYLAAVERAQGLVTRSLDAPADYRGGSDFMAWSTDLQPLIIVVVTPTGAPERPEPTKYAQWFEVQVGAIVKAEDEQDARWRADAYGIALAVAVSNNGGLGANPYDPTVSLAASTEMTEFPVTTFAVDPESNRNIMRSVVTFHVLVQPVFEKWGGPTSWAFDPYTSPGDWPTVKADGVTVTVAGVADLP